MSHPGDIKSDLKAVATDLSQRLLNLFGDNTFEPTLAERLRKNIEVTTQDAYFVYCIGTPSAIPIDDIYQPSIFSGSGGEPIHLDRMLAGQHDSLIFAGPGVGKTTFLNYAMI